MNGRRSIRGNNHNLRTRTTDRIQRISSESDEDNDPINGTTESTITISETTNNVLSDTESMGSTSDTTESDTNATENLNRTITERTRERRRTSRNFHDLQERFRPLRRRRRRLRQTSDSSSASEEPPATRPRIILNPIPAGEGVEELGNFLVDQRRLMAELEELNNFIVNDSDEAEISESVSSSSSSSEDDLVLQELRSIRTFTVQLRNFVGNGSLPSPVDHAIESDNSIENTSLPLIDNRETVIQPTTSSTSSTVATTTVKASTSKIKDENNQDKPEDDDSMLCSICFEPWTSSGEHRMCCLKCGHTFGKCCIVKWIKTAKKCPTCNTKASVKDVRLIYTRSLNAIDTSEKDMLSEEVAKYKSKVDNLEREKARAEMKSELNSQLLKKIEKEFNMLKNGHADVNKENKPNCDLPSMLATQKLVKLTSLSTTKDGKNRVMAHNDWLDMIVVSMNSPMSMFPGYGLRKINVREMIVDNFIHLHSKEIRDLAFNPSRKDLLLSVSLDKSAKILNVTSNCVVNTYPTNNPLWCCCWNIDKTNEFFVGASSGSIFHYDTTKSDCFQPMDTYNLSGTGPITSIAYISSKPTDEVFQKGLLVVRLNSIIFLELLNGTTREHVLPIEGAFIGVFYDFVSKHFMVTCRPSQKNQLHAHARHRVFRLQNVVDALGNSKVTSVETQCFKGGTTMKLLSRGCLAPMPGCTNGTLAVFSEENTLTTKLYDISTGQLVDSFKTNNTIIDVLSVQCQNNNMIAALGPQSLTIHKWMELKKF